jgi:hypothetical protein
MRLLIVLLLSAMVVCTAQQTKPAAKKEPAKSAKSSKAPKATLPKPTQIPAGAVEYEPYKYRFTDKSGKKWIYNKTPFGVVRRPDLPAQAAASDQGGEVKAWDAGDSVRFERSSPFGPVKWERKKGELTDAERAVWDREQARAAQQQAQPAPRD